MDIALHVLQWTGYASVMVATLALCLPFEQMFPRILRRDLTWMRTRAIGQIAVLTFFVSQAFVWWGQSPLVNFLLQFKIYSLAKADIPDWALIAVSVLILDLAYYLTHVVSHVVPPLWRLHRIHHADEHVTALSGFLHHPLESIYSAAITLLFVVLLGMPVLVVIIYGGLLAAHSIFSHADVAVPGRIDRVLRNYS
jgi:sterol desaturase/sphingolipid hydroxylase (fatty acid hydroxylase superfamily)